MPKFLKDYAMRFAAKSRRVAGSSKFFYATVLLFVVEAGWLALTAVYPQAFDEQFHLGIIKLYSHQWTPFFSHQPAGADVFGAVTRDPSYMYHYLMSFPYRLVAHFTSSLPVQVISLRLISVALLASGLFVYRRLLRAVPLPTALVNVALLFFVLIPVVPLLGAQINYDNALFPLTGLSLLWTVGLLRSMQAERKLPLALVLKLLALCMFTSLVMYSFLPFFVAIAVLFLIQMVRTRLYSPASLVASFRRLGLRQGVLLGVVVAVVLGLFVTMYGVNIVRYHTPVPDCGAVIGDQACIAYPPWGRDYWLIQAHPKLTTSQVVTYPAVWLHQTLDEMTFAISSKFEGDGVTVDYNTANSLPVMVVLSWVVTAGGAVLAVIYRRQLWHNLAFRVFMVVSATYTVILFFQNFGLFLQTGQPLAIHGRYLVPILPLLLAIMLQCLVWLVQRQKASVRHTLYAGQLWLVILGIVLMVQGSGFITYIVRSDPDWLWPQNSSIHKVNHTVKKVLHPVVVGSKHPS